MTDQQKLENLALSIYKETKDNWSRYSNDNDYIRDHGYWVMVGPPKVNPPVFIVSSNPGASSSSMRALSIEELTPHAWPVTLNYTRQISPFAKKLASIFDGVEGLSLEDCCASFRLFFRSKSLTDWKSAVPEHIRKEVEETSRYNLLRIIEASSPKLILAVGGDSYESVATAHLKTEQRPWGTKTIDLLKTGKLGRFPVLGVPHVSGAHLSREHMAEISSRISSLIQVKGKIDEK